MRFIEELSETTGISWWDENRKRINEAIQWYNEFVENGTRSPELIIAKVDQIRRFGQKNEFSRWQFDILNDIESRVAIEGKRR
jgi:hypothetical protein